MKRKITYTIITMTLIVSAFLIGRNTSNKEVNKEKTKTEHTIDMSKATDFKTTETGLQIYFNDGTGYYFEKKN